MCEYPAAVVQAGYSSRSGGGADSGIERWFRRNEGVDKVAIDVEISFAIFFVLLLSAGLMPKQRPQMQVFE